MDKDQDPIVKEAQKAYEEARSAIDGWNSEATTDMQFYLSEQWDEKDKRKLLKKGVPVLNLNVIKKTIDLISGYQRQNRSDLKYYPIEGGDSLVSEVLSKISHWVMKSNMSRFYLSEAFKDSINVGIGWIRPEVDYSKDPVNGDIYIRHESPFNMLFDPFFTELDLSDCSYVIRHKLLNKKKAMELWPESADEIKVQGAATKDQSFRQDADVPSDQGNMVLVWEYWYRTYENKKFAISEAGDMEEIDEDMEAELEMDETVTVIERKMPLIKVAIMIGQETGKGKPVVVFHDESPYATQEYPFIPIFCYLTSSYSEWDKKLQGLIRPLRDPQREKNKRRSIIMQMFSTVASSGYDIEKGAYDDINQLRTGGAGKIYERNRGFNPAMRLPSPEVPASAIQLEQMFSNDITLIGANADLLGNLNERGAAGITIQLRQKQGMTALQEVFDNLSMAIQRFGRILVELIVANFDRSKVERILGEEVPYKKDIEALNKQIQALTQEIQQGAQSLQQMAGREVRGDELGDEQAQAQVDQMNQQEVMFQEHLTQMNVQLQQMQQQLQMLMQEQEAFWMKWDDLEVNSRYDCSVSEAMESETYRISVLSALMQYQQYGGTLPPDVLLEYIDIPDEIKTRTREYQEQMMQMQQQQAQAQMQMEQQKVNNQKEIELIKQGIVPPAGGPNLMQ